MDASKPKSISTTGRFQQNTISLPWLLQPYETRALSPLPPMIQHIMTVSSSSTLLASYSSKSRNNNSKNDDKTKTKHGETENLLDRAPLSTVATSETTSNEGGEEDPPSLNPQQQPTESSGRLWENPDMLPSEFHLLTDASQRKRLLEETPVGSLSSEEVQMLRDAYERGKHLVQIASIEQNQPLSSPPQPGHSNNREFLGHLPQGRRRGRLPKRTKGTLSLDWPYLTNVVLEGWILLNRLGAELEYQRSQSTQPIQPLDPLSDRTSTKNDENDSLSPWVLQTWRMIHLHQIPEDNDSCQQLLLTPEQIYPMLRCMLDHNQFIWSSHLVSFVLDVIQQRANTLNNRKPDGRSLTRLRDAASLGQEVFDALIVVNPSSDPAWQFRLPDRELISKLASMWSKSMDVDAPYRSIRLLALLEQVHRLRPELDKYSPDAFVYASVLQCWTRPPKTYDPQLHDHMTDYDLSLVDQRIKSSAGLVALRLLEEGQENYGVEMTRVLYDTILQCVTRADDVHSQRQALALLEERVAIFVKAHRGSTAQQLLPTSDAYMSLLHSYVRSGQTHQAAELLEKMETLATEMEQNRLMPPDAAFAVVQEALNRKTQAHGSDHRYPFLQWSYSPKTQVEWERGAVDAWAHIQTDLIRAFGNNEDPSLAIRDAFALLDTVAAHCFRHARHVSPGFLPWQREVLTVAIDSWKRFRWMIRNGKVKSSNQRWGRQCRAPQDHPRWLLNRLNNYLAVGMFRPTGKNLDYMLELIEKTTASKSKGYTTHFFAEALLRFLLVHRGHYSEDPDCPDAFAMRRAMKLWRNAALYNGTRLKEEIEGGERIVNRLFRWYSKCGEERYRPDAEICSNLVEIWIESLAHEDPDAVARRASEILQHWQQLGTEQVEDPAEVWKLHHAVTRARALVSSPEQTQEFFDSVILKCRSGNHNLMDPGPLLVALVEELGHTGKPEFVVDAVSKMVALSKDLGDGRLRPTTKCFNALIEAYGLAGELIKVEEIFHSLLKPKVVGAKGDSRAVFADLDTWNKVLEAWVRSGSQAAASRSVDLLRQLEASSEPLPNSKTFDLVLQCFLTASDPKSIFAEAGAILDRMETVDAAPKPNGETYLKYMKLAKMCNMPDECSRALHRFCELCEHGTIRDRPDVRHFNTVIRAHADEKGKDQESFAKAMNAFQAMTEASYIFHKLSTETVPFSAEPNAETYEALLDIALDSASSSKDQLSRSEAVVEAVLQQRWHESPVNKDSALALFHRVLDCWSKNGAENVASLRELISNLQQGMISDTAAVSHPGNPRFALDENQSKDRERGSTASSQILDMLRE